jgi:hypothetical protein
MALNKLTRPAFAWDLPTWTNDVAAHTVARVGYNPFADELVVQFANAAGRVPIVEPIETPHDHYANVMADHDTGDVIGVQIDNLRAAALAHFPHWAEASTEAEPPPAAIDRLVRDVHDLFTRYGIGGYVWNGEELIRDR